MICHKQDRKNVYYLHQILRNFAVIFLLLFPSSVAAQNHWESIIVANDTFRYLPAISEPDADWNILGFSDDGWEKAPGSIGYGDGDDTTLIDPVNSLYLRISFSVGSDTLIEKLLLDIDYDDAFVACLNGTEFARSDNVSDPDPAYNAALAYDREAQMYRGGQPERHEVDTSLLEAGKNILSIHIINDGLSSSDLSSIIFLHGLIHADDTIYHLPPDWFMEPVEFSSNLPIVVIDTDGQQILDEPRRVAHMGIIGNGNDSVNRICDPFTGYNGRINIEIRGQSAQMFPKKSCAFETQDSMGMNLNVSLLGMPPGNDWILYAPYSDKSMLRNVFTFELGRRTGQYCSRTVYCELILNGQYQGVYVLMEKIKQDDHRVDMAKLEPSETSGDDLTGGYIFRVDKLDPDYAPGIDGWSSSPNPSYPGAKDIIYQYCDPKPRDLVEEQRQYLKDAVTQAENTLISGEFDDPTYGYNRYLNTGSFVDFLLINEISKEVDKYRYSSYFYKKQDSKGGEIFAGPPWDFNLGYGNVDYWPEGLNTGGWLFEDVKPYEWSIIFWWKRLMEDPHFENLVTTRWLHLRQKSFSDGQINGIIDSLTTLIDEAQKRNYQRWPILGTYIWPNHDWANNTYEDEVDYFRTWVLNRLEWMDINVGGRSLNPAANLSAGPYNSMTNTLDIKLSLNDDYFEHAVLERHYFTLNDNQAPLYIRHINYLSASEALLEIASLNSAPVPGKEVSVTVDKAILTGFRAINTNNIVLNTPEGLINAEDSLVVYASSGRIVIEYNHPEELPHQFEIYNTTGRLVGLYPLKKARRNEVPVDLPTNVYMVRLIMNNKSYTRKLLVF